MVDEMTCPDCSAKFVRQDLFPKHSWNPLKLTRGYQKAIEEICSEGVVLSREFLETEILKRHPNIRKFTRASKPELCRMSSCPDPAWVGPRLGITASQFRGLYDSFDQDEKYFVQFIKDYLLTPNQKAFLQEHDISVTDCLCGRTPIDLSKAIYRNLYRPWNDKLGYKQFSDDTELGQSLLDSIRNMVGPDIQISFEEDNG